MEESLLRSIKSPLREVFEKVRNLRREGREIHDFTVGEPTWPVSKDILEKLTAQISARSHYGYPPAGGLPELRDAIALDYADRSGSQRSSGNVVVANGAKQAIKAAMRAVLSPGDSVIIFSPYYPTYISAARFAGATPVIVESGEDHLPNLEALVKNYDRTCRLMVINTPCNPTGAVYNKRLIIELTEFALERWMYVLFDECYRCFTFEGFEHFSMSRISEMKNHLIVVDSFSKSHAMAGFRLGYAVAPQEIAQKMCLLMGEETSGVNLLSQWAGLIALSTEVDMVSVRRQLEENRTLLIKELSQVEGMSMRPPKGAFYVFPRVNNLYGRLKVSGSLKCADYLLDRGIAVTPGVAFGDDNSVRLSFCHPREVVQKAALALVQALR